MKKYNKTFIKNSGKIFKGDIFYEDWFLVTILIALCIYLFIFKLGISSLWNMDEPIYGEVSKEILKLGDWVTLHFNYQEWFDKPPLYMWLTAINFKIFGWSEFTVRIWSALFGIGGVITVYFLGKNIFNRRVGFLSALILSTSVQYIIQSRLALLDVPLNFFISLSILFFYLGYTMPNKRWCYLLFYLSLALATLTKGPIGIIIPALIVGLYLLLTGDLRELKNMMLFQGIIIYFAIASPWYIIELIRHGDVFINNFFLQRTIARFLTPFEQHSGPFYYYIPILFLGFFPWSSFLPYAFVHLITFGKWEDKASPTQQDENSLVRRGEFSRLIIYKFLYFKKGWKIGEGKKVLLILLWFAVVFVFFSSAKSKLPGYIFPLYPSVALVVGKFWDSFLFQKDQYRKSMTISFALFFALLMILLFAIILVAKPAFPIEYGLFGRDAILIIMGLIIGGGISLLVLFYKKSSAISFWIIVGMMCFFTWILAGHISPKTDIFKPTKSLAGKIISEIQIGEKIGNYPSSNKNFMSFNCNLIYYSDHPVIGINNANHLISFLSSKKRVYCLMGEEDYNKVKGKLREVTVYILDKKGNQILLSNKE